MRRSSRVALHRIGLVLVAGLAHGQAARGAAPPASAATMHDLQDHFAACFHPPAAAAGTRITFYFSLNTRGDVVAPPRTVWFGFKGSEADKTRELSGFRTAFAGCLPLAMQADLAASIPGKVYFLQYVVDERGETRQVLLRPFGSHGGGLQPPANVDVEPAEPIGATAGPAARTTGPPPYVTGRRLRPSGPFGRIIGPFRIRPRARLFRDRGR